MRILLSVAGTYDLELRNYDIVSAFLRSKLKGDITKAKRMKNSCRKAGVKHLSKAIGEKQAKPLTGVVRDRDTVHGRKE